MRLGPECYLCIYKQVFNLTGKLGIEEGKRGKIMRGAASILANSPMELTPPEVAGQIYPYLSEATGVADPFEREKRESIEGARRLKPSLLKIVEESEEPVAMALRVSALGNVIDFGVVNQIDLERELELLHSLHFARWDYPRFLKEAERAKTLFLIGDNAGENVMDEILVETLLRHTSIEKVYYGVRGGAIINDVTIKEVEGSPMAQLAEIVDTGVKLPGFHPDYASPSALRLFREADLVIAKGMGNYETLTQFQIRPLFFLLKVKCGRVARATSTAEGDYIFMEYGPFQDG
jgi:uncharacterized protein with ATP-grasp and redox domains